MNFTIAKTGFDVADFREFDFFKAAVIANEKAGHDLEIISVAGNGIFLLKTFEKRKSTSRM